MFEEDISFFVFIRFGIFGLLSEIVHYLKNFTLPLTAACLVSEGRPGVGWVGRPYLILIKLLMTLLYKEMCRLYVTGTYYPKLTLNH